MKFLLDTHILLWWLSLDGKLSKKGIEIISEASNIIFVSAASIWEIRIKEALEKIHLPKEFYSTLEKESFEKLSISFDHAHEVRKLPLHHRDPFDRMLIAQAKLEGLTLLTNDNVVEKYQIESLLV